MKQLITDVGGKINPDTKSAYPYVKEILIGKKSKTVKSIGQVTHNKKQQYGGRHNNFKYENAIGNSNPRFSSPIYVSLIKSDNKLYPVITKLNTVPPQDRNVDYNVQQEFINSILK